MKGIILGAALALAPIATAASAAPGARVSQADAPFTIEYYYKIKLGHDREWMELYRRNHWPIMAAELKSGEILAFKIDEARDSWPEPVRWDVRVSITWKNALVAHKLVPTGREELEARLFPDRAKHEAEEQKRMSLLDGLWTSEVKPVDLTSWPR